MRVFSRRAATEGRPYSCAFTTPYQLLLRVFLNQDNWLQLVVDSNVAHLDQEELYGVVFLQLLFDLRQRLLSDRQPTILAVGSEERLSVIARVKFKRSGAFLRPLCD